MLFENDVNRAPLRSYIFNSVKDLAYLPKAFRWLYKEHVEDSISMLQPFCTKYCTYHALPVPQDGEDFGTYNWIMTEHHYVVDRMHFYGPKGRIVPYAERYSKEFLEITNQPPTNELRDTTWRGTRDGYHPIVNCYAPLYWQHDFKGQTRTIDDGANYRWLTIFKYPEGVSMEEGDAWFFNTLVPELVAVPEVTRFLTAPCIPHVEKGPWQRVVELWFEDSHRWHDGIVKNSSHFTKPSWAQYNVFPYLEPYKDFTGMFLLDRPDSNHLTQFNGYIVTR